MIKTKIQIILIMLCLFGHSTIKAQLYIDTINVNTDGIDSYVAREFSTTNYGTDTTLQVYYNGKSKRSYLDLDLSGIPTNAVIISAKLYLNALSVNNTQNHPMYVQRVLASWSEGSVTWSNQPAVTTSGQISIAHSTTSSTGWQTFEITSLVQHSVHHPSINYGWCITLQTESGATNGVIYASSEHGTSSLRPYLEVRYVLPIEVNGLVKHCDYGESNGEITVSVSGGSASYSSYEWFEYDNGTVTSIQNGSGISTINIDSLSDGLYLCKVTDSYSVVGYKYFLVGMYGETTRVSFKNNSSSTNSALFNEDAMLLNDVAKSDGTRAGGSETGIYAYRTSTAYFSSVVKYQVDFDSMFTINTAELRLISEGHYRSSSPVTTDSGYVSMITQDWNEVNVTWNTKPTTTTTNRQVIDETNPAGAVTRNDSIDIIDFVEYWQQNPDENYGVDISLKKYSQSANAYLRYYSYDNTTSANRPSLFVEFSLPDQVITEFIDSLDKGEITINAPAGEFPYTYIIGYDTIPDLGDLWDNIKDSITVDSLVFFRGKSNIRNYTFTDLESERYYVAIFDNNGNRIFDKEVFLTAPTSLGYNFHLDDDTLKVDDAYTSGYGALDLSLDYKESGGLEFKLEQLGDIMFGFNYENQTTARFSADFEFAIEIDSSDSHFKVTKGGSVLFEDTTLVNDIFRISKENYELVVYRNEYEMYRHSLTETPTFDFRIDVVFNTKGGILSNAVQVGKIKIAKPIYANVTNGQCPTGYGTILMKFNTSTFSSVTGGSYVVKNANTNSTVTSGSFTSTNSLLLSLPVGDYKVIYTTTGTPAISWTEYFSIGQPVLWDFLNAHYSSIGINTIETNNYVNVAQANSQNILVEEESEGFVSFKLGTKKNYQIWADTPLPIYPSYSQVGFIKSDGENLLRLRATSYGPNIISKWIEVYDSTDSVINTPFDTNLEGTFKIKLYNDSLKTYFNSSTTYFAVAPLAIDDDFRVSARSYNGYVKDAYVDFCYGSTTSEQCAELYYELDGNYYVTNNGYFCFTYNQEYNDSTIVFNIYNNSSVIIADQTDFALEDMIYGENRVVLDFTQFGNCIGKGFYVLEVINSKNEHFYLRFYNGYNGCMAIDTGVSNFNSSF